MKVHFENVFKNMRYKIFSVDGEHYILEIKPSFWKSLFPFLYWFFPFPVYKVEDEETIKRIKTPESWSMNKSSVAISAGGFAVIGAHYFRYLMEKFTPEISLYMKFISVIMAVLCVLFLRLYVNRVKQRDLYKIVNLNQLDKSFIKLNPQSLKHIFQQLTIYIMFLFLFVMAYYLYITLEGNILVLFAGSAMLLVLTIVSNISVKEGWTTIKFINK